MSDRDATQIFAIQNIIINYCGKYLTPDTVDSIMNDIRKEMQDSPTAWAFKETDKRDR